MKRVNTEQERLNKYPVNTKIGAIGVQTIFTAILAVAITFTLSCSGSDDPDNGGDPNNPNGGGGVPFNENSQVYNGYGFDNVFYIGDAYKGSGIIEMTDGANGGCSNDGDGGFDCSYKWDGLSAGSVTDGIVTLNLPTTVPNEYLWDFLEEEDKKSCTEFTDVKVFGGAFVLTNSNKDYIGDLGIFADSYPERIRYYYFSKAAKIVCNIEFEDHGDEYNYIYNIDAKEGWNTIYYHRTYPNGISAEEISTNNILTKELKWVLY